MGLWGFLFAPLGLIAAAGLSDRKLRKYIKQIGEKQEAIKAEPLLKTSDEAIKEKVIGSFELVQAAADADWEKILSLFISEIANKADRSNLYKNTPIFGSIEFVVNDSNSELLVFASRKEYAINKYLWEVSLGWIRLIPFLLVF